MNARKNFSRMHFPLQISGRYLVQPENQEAQQLLSTNSTGYIAMSDRRIKSKICFLIQPPGLGGLSVYHDRLQQLLEKKYQVDLFVLNEVNFSDILDKYEVVQLFFTPLLSPSIILSLLRRRTRVFGHYYNIKNEPKWKLLIKSLLIP